VLQGLPLQAYLQHIPIIVHFDFVNGKAVLMAHLTSFLDDPMKGPSQKVCVFLPAPFCAGWAKAMVLSYSNYDVDERTH